MPELGDKVGDAYIEVHAEVDKGELAKAQKQLQASTLKAQKDLNSKLVRNEREAKERSHIQALRIEKTRIQEMGRMQIQAINEDKKRTEAAYNDRMRREKKWNAYLLQNRKEFEKKQSGGRKRYKDGGVPGLGETAENIASILPGQLEKLLRNPYIAAAAVTLGVGLSGFIAQGLAGGLAGAVGGGVIIGAIVGLVKNDQDVANAWSELGNRSMSAFLDQAVKFKPQVITLFRSMGSEISSFIRGLDLGQLVGSIEPIRKGFGRFLQDLQPGIQALIDIGGPILRDLFSTILPGIAKSFTNMANVIKKEGPSIRITMIVIGKIIEIVIDSFAGLVKMGATAVQSLIGLELKALDFAKTLANVYNGVASKIPGLKDKLIDTSGIDRQIAVVHKNNKAWADMSYTLGEVGTSLSGLTDDTGAATIAGKSLAEQAQAQADAFQNAFDKQQQYDGALRTGLDTQQTWTLAQQDIRTLLKENGRTLDQNTVKGVRNAQGIDRAFRDLKATYLEDVKAGKISADKAKEQFRARAQAILDKFDKNSPAYKTFKGFIDMMDDFPKNVTVNFEEVGLATLRANIATLRAQLSGLKGEGARKKAEADLDKQKKASGGAVFGAGTGTSDSIPAMLSNGEFVIKASSAKKIGYGNLGMMNSTGKAPSGFATGGKVGNGRGSSGAEKRAYESLLKQIATLSKTISAQTKALEAYNSQLSASREQFKSFVNLGALSTEGKSTGDLIQQLQGRKAAAGGFASRLASLKKKGLSATALQQVSEAGPDSDLAKMLMSASAYDVGLINRLLGGSEGYAKSIGKTIFPKGPGMAKSLASNQKKLAAKKKAAARLKPVRAKGATISYAGGRTSALFSSKELAQQQLKTGTYVTVVIDGKEVRAIVKEEQRKTVSKSNRQLKSGRK